MKKYISKLFLFLLPLIIFALFYVIVSFTILPKAMEKSIGPSTKMQMDTSFRNAAQNNYNLLIIGNSNIYTGINPDLLTIPSYNFSFNNDSYNQIYFKLLWLEKAGKKYNYLILGVDYFQFSVFTDTRNYAYNDYLGIDYQADYSSSNVSSWPIETSNIKDIKRLKYLMYYLTGTQSKTYLKSNGQYINPGKATPEDKYAYTITRLPIQEKYFEMILDFCKKNKTLVFLVMKPTRKNALQNYKEIEINEFNKYIIEHTNDSVFYLNFSNLPDYTYEDFTDITHLNESAANRFTKYLNSILLDKIKSLEKP
jgi:hypothetical protein